MSQVPGPQPADGPPSLSLLRGFARGVGWTYLGVLATGVGLIFLTGWSVRRVGLEQYGAWALIVSLTNLLAVFDYGLGMSVTHGAARATASWLSDEERAAGRELCTVGHSAYALLGGAALVLTAVVTGVVRLTGLRGVSGAAATVALLGVASAVTVGTAALPSLAVGCERFALRAGASVAGVVARVVVVMVTITHMGIAGLALGQLVGIVVERGAIAAKLRRVEPWFRLRPVRPERRAVRRSMSFAMPLLVLNASGQLFALSDLLSVGVLVGSAAVALYQVGALLPLHLKGLIFVGYNVAYPAVAGSADAKAQERATALLTRIVSFVAAVAFATCIVLRGDVVELLSGRTSALSETVLVLLCVAGLLDVGVHGPASLLVARGRQKLMARAVALEIPLNLVLSVGLVVAFGATGAAWATLATVLVMDLLVFPRVSRGQFAQPATVLLLRNCIAPALFGASLALGVAAATAGVGSSAIRVAATAVGAAGLGLAVGTILLRPEDRRQLRTTFQQKGHTLDPAEAARSPVG